MTDGAGALVLDLLEWIGPTPRPYAEVMEAWRTSCPRLPIWEDAVERGFIERHYEPGVGAVVAVSTCGLRYLRQHRTLGRELM
jgi:D-3-phosphoglycerate dehydrogenase